MLKALFVICADFEVIVTKTERRKHELFRSKKKFIKADKFCICGNDIY